MLAGKVDIATKLKSQPLETQRLLWVSEIQGLQVTVIGSGTSGKDICLSQSGRDGILHVTLGIGDSRITVHLIWDRERQAITVVSQSGRDGTLHVAELNSVVSTDEASATTLKWL